MSLRRLLVSKGNPMFWPPAEGALLACLMTILMNLLFLATGLVAQVLPQVAMHVEQPVLRQFNLFSLAMIALWSSVFLLILVIRRNNPQSQIPGLIVTYLFGHPMVVMAYFNGVHSMVTGLLLAATPAFGFVMFRNRHVMNALLLIWLEIILLGLAVSLGWLTDAPLYGDQPPNRFLVPIWFFIQVLIGFPVALALIMITRYIVSTLRAREAQVLELSRRDALTGVWNRGYLNELIAREVAIAERSGQPLAMVVADLDLFKRINDEYGHTVGDRALIHAARSLAASIREVDHLGRYGGEEFVVLLPNCDEGNARIAAERCRKALSAEPVKTEQAELTLNGSFGVASVRGNKINSDELFRRADQALYEAKEAGRNQVMVAN